MNTDVFNGDADGLCSVHQWRLAHPEKTRLLTGVKRDIRLLSRLEAKPGDHFSVFDISFDSNRSDAERLLAAGAELQWFDHHFSGDIPSHPGLHATIDTSAETCTSLLVDHALAGRFRAWAVTGAFGDNLHRAARNAAATLLLSGQDLDALAELGELLNYNGYGDHLSDLHISPDVLYQEMAGFEHPLDFIAHNPAFALLREGFSADLAAADALVPRFSSPHCALYLLPDQAWARRVIGVLANRLAMSAPDRAHALAVPNATGDLTVSVRAPKSRPAGADTLCLKFPSGGGRKAAAGINKLPETDLAHFFREFSNAFS